MSPGRCSGQTEDLLLFAADVLEPAEREAVRAHLQTGCARCAEDLVAARETLAAVSLGLDPRSPPGDVKRRLMRRVRADEPAGARAPRLGRSRWRVPLAAAAAASVTLLAAHQWLVAPEVELRGRFAGELERVRAEHASIEAEVQELEARLEQARDSARRADLEVRLLRSKALEVVDLHGDGLFGDASARIFWDYDAYLCYVHASGLEPARDGSRYVLWVFAEGGRHFPVGEIAPDFGGEATLFAELPRDFGRIVRSVVTEEPGSGASREAPAGPVALRWSATES